MQLLKHYDPLNLPRGSIRALVTIALLVTLWSLILLPGKDVPLVLTFLTLMVVGHYFGSRSLHRSDDVDSATGERRVRVKGPLGMPLGTIRTMIILGFSTVGYYYLRDKDPKELTLEDRGTAVLFLVGAMLVGLSVRKLSDLVSRGQPIAPVRCFENLKAVVVIVATALLIIGSVLGQDKPGMQHMTLYTAPLIGFYFGSRK
jgi:hypothetical protein